MKNNKRFIVLVVILALLAMVGLALVLHLPRITGGLYLWGVRWIP